jgi:hypothetical protein
LILILASPLPGRRAPCGAGKPGSENDPQPSLSHRHLSTERFALVKPKDIGEPQGCPAVAPEGDGERED